MKSEVSPDESSVLADGEWSAVEMRAGRMRRFSRPPLNKKRQTLLPKRTGINFLVRGNSWAMVP